MAPAKAAFNCEHGNCEHGSCERARSYRDEEGLMPGAPRRGSGGERRERRDDRRGGAADKQATYLEHVVKINREAKKHFFRVPRIASTIPHTVQGEEAAGVVLLKPASPGTGVIAGGPVRAVLECAGIHDVLSRSLGSSNPINVVHATVAALKSLSRPEEIAAKRGLPIE